jgi:hypothetical protein
MSGYPPLGKGWIFYAKKTGDFMGRPEKQGWYVATTERDGDHYWGPYESAEDAYRESTWLPVTEKGLRLYQREVVFAEASGDGCRIVGSHWGRT